MGVLEQLVFMILSPIVTNEGNDVLLDRNGPVLKNEFCRGYMLHQETQ